MAQAWCTLGSEVTLIEASDRLLGREEPFAAEQVATSLRERGVDVRLGAKAVAVRRERTGGEVTVELDQGLEVRADELAVAAGRRPRTDDLGLETVGLEPGKWIDVDDQLRAIAVEGDWLYAIGDVNARALLTHISKYHARVASDNILGKSAAATADGPGSPRVLFTDPQVAAVGHTLQSALDAGLNVHTVEAPHLWQRRRQLLRHQRCRHHPSRGRRRPASGGRRHDHRLRGSGLPASRHDRSGGRGAARASGPRRARVSHAQ
jgi:pyruvate/2-oxoglutarate dehydrogenase complex dihydrolipoamide dehydrogenase (E3) component